jgi:hypothetical protein
VTEENPCFEQLYALEANDPDLLAKRNPLYEILNDPQNLTLSPSQLRYALSFSQDLGAAKAFLALQAGRTAPVQQGLLQQLGALNPSVDIQLLPRTMFTSFFTNYNGGMLDSIHYDQSVMDVDGYSNCLERLGYQHQAQLEQHQSSYSTSKQLLATAEQTAAAARRQQQECLTALEAARARANQAQQELVTIRSSHAMRERAEEVLKQRTLALFWHHEQITLPGSGPSTPVGFTLPVLDFHLPATVEVLNVRYQAAGAEMRGADVSCDHLENRLLMAEIQRLRLTSGYARNVGEEFVTAHQGEAYDPLHLYNSESFRARARTVQENMSGVEYYGRSRV